jgi:alkylhydroperoxidase family enzyme
MPEFRSAAELGAGFHAEVVAPLVGDVGYAAGLLGWGSDVLGYDTERSRDHGWGPRMVVLVDADEVERVRSKVEAGLPDDYRGHAVRFGWDSLEPRHHVTVTTVGDWLNGQLGFDARQGIEVEDWLITPQQQLLGVVAGRVYADDGRLAAVREALAWYPDQVWRWLLMCQWLRIAQEEAFAQRTHEVGDELGSRVVTARLVRDIMRLALLQSRTYAPYTKWLGTAFARLGHADGLNQALSDAMTAGDFAGRERALMTAYELVARRHNALRITDEVDPATRPYYDRPAMVLGANRFVDACGSTVTDPLLRRIAPTGSIDQFADNTDVLANPSTYRRLISLYR